MTANRPNQRPRPFGPDELDGVPGIRPEELAAETRLARDIEAVAARGGAAPPPALPTGSWVPSPRSPSRLR